MQIVSVEAAKQHLYIISFEDGQHGEIDKTVWEHSGLSVGSELSDSEWESLCTRSGVYRAREKALYYLSSRDYGSGELVQKLCRAGIDRSLAEQTIERLCDSGLIDDTRYATMLARDLQARKLYPKRRVAMALREKGFSSDLIAQVVEELPDEEEEQALELLRKKRYNGSCDAKQREKALGMLARYGFSYAVSARALKRLEEGLAEDYGY